MPCQVNSVKAKQSENARALLARAKGLMVFSHKCSLTTTQLRGWLSFRGSCFLHINGPLKFLISVDTEGLKTVPDGKQQRPPLHWLASYKPRGVVIDFSEKGQVKHWIMELQLSYTIANGVEWLWSPSDSLNICFCGTWPCTTYNSVPIILILLTNKNVALIYSVTICEQRTKDCAPSGSFQHKVKHCCFYLRCLPSFITSPLYYGFKYRCFSHLPGDAPMRGSWTFQIKQMVTDVMN